ncbi:DUF819 family protein [Clostridioides difficile]
MLYQCNIKKIWKESGRLLIIFLVGSVGTVLGAMIGFLALKNGNPKILVVLRGLYLC